jgi:hypothetical protein
MEINENSGGTISLELAIKYIKAFRENFPDETRCSFIGAINVKLILEQKGCIGIRIYNGYDIIEKTEKLVLVGVDSDGCDITDGVIMDRLIPCPRCCDVRSLLNP